MSSNQSESTIGFVEDAREEVEAVDDGDCGTDAYYQAVTDLLRETNETVTGDRQDTHGHIVDNFEQIAEFWSAYLEIEVTSTDVAELMVLVKISRQQVGSQDVDHYKDQAGYSAIAGAISEVSGQ